MDLKIGLKRVASFHHLYPTRKSSKVSEVNVTLTEPGNWTRPAIGKDNIRQLSTMPTG